MNTGILTIILTNRREKLSYEVLYIIILHFIRTHTHTHKNYI